MVPDPRKVRLLPYLRHLADVMGLKDWHVELDSNPTSDNGNHAEASTYRGRKRLRVALSEVFLGSSEEDQRATMVHELIHAHGSAMDFVVMESIPEDVERAYKLTMEYMVDGIADAWAVTLPLPSAILDAKES